MSELPIAVVSAVALAVASSGEPSVVSDDAAADTPDNGPDDAVETSASLYIRGDTDRTTVVSPRARVRAPLGTPATHVELVYAVDVWTSASIDVRTAASDKVTEQRDEVSASVEHAWDRTTLGLGYRLSHEIDYLSNAGNLSLTTSLAQRTVTLEGRVFAGGDIVGRAGDESFRETIGYGGVFAGYTQVLTPSTVLQLGAEFRGQQGYLESPYRWVSIGAGGQCAGGAGLCIAEQHPGRRLRGSGAARVRQALARRWSTGLGYRAYGDTWKVWGHTVDVDISYSPRAQWTLTAQGRGYTQGSASFYRSVYPDVATLGWVTRDRELSSLWDVRGTLVAEGRWRLTGGTALKLGVLGSLAYYRYRDFVGLTDVTAWELSSTVGVAF